VVLIFTCFGFFFLFVLFVFCFFLGGGRGTGRED